MSVPGGRILGGLLFVLVAVGFAWLNEGQHVGLHLGLFRLRSVSLSVVFFVAFMS